MYQYPARVAAAPANGQARAGPSEVNRRAGSIRIGANRASVGEEGVFLAQRKLAKKWPIGPAF